MRHDWQDCVLIDVAGRFGTAVLGYLKIGYMTRM